MIVEKLALAPLPQQTLEVWHRFVASGDPEILRSLLSERIVFRSPIVQSPIPGRAAALLVLTTVVQIFENFTYHRSFVAGTHDAGLEFTLTSANGSSRASISSSSTSRAK
ncbi:MAG TPA: hypothetical protein VKB08_19890 [Bradyrhizobium sp.]|nr:hypothetical protein [Bradyrhizobium sp.]